MVLDAEPSWAPSQQDIDRTTQRQRRRVRSHRVLAGNVSDDPAAIGRWLVPPLGNVRPRDDLGPLSAGQSPRGHFSRESVHFFEDWTDIGISRDHPNKNGQI